MDRFLEFVDRLIASLKIYFKTVVSSMTYCISVWGTSSNVILDAIENLHSRAAKLIHKIKDRTLTNEEIIDKVNWQPISYIYKKRLLT